MLGSLGSAVGSDVALGVCSADSAVLEDVEVVGLQEGLQQPSNRRTCKARSMGISRLQALCSISILAIPTGSVELAQVQLMSGRACGVRHGTEPPLRVGAHQRKMLTPSDGQSCCKLAPSEC